MSLLTQPLPKQSPTSRNGRSQSTARKRFQKYLRIEQLEDRRLLAVVAAWSAENNAQDSVGGNNGTLYNGATYATGQIGQAFKFDGINDRINVADSPSLKLTQSMTIEGWIKVNALPAGAPFDHGEILFRGDDRGGLDPYSLSTEPGGTIRFSISPITNQGVSIQASVPTGQFFHVAATLDDATGAMRLYLNGTLVAQTTTSARPFGDLDPSSNPGIGIGNHGGFPTTPHNFPFNGLIDELKVYDHALTAADVLANFDAGKGNLQPTISVSDANVTEGDQRFAISQGKLVNQIESGGLTRSSGMTYGPDGNLYVGSFATNEILRYSPSGEFLDAFVSSGSGGLSTPSVGAVIFRPDGKLYVASRDNANVLRYDANTGEFLNVFVPSGSGGLAQIKGMTFGPDGHLYISSSATNQILRYNGTTGAYLGAFVAAGSGGLSNPRSLTFAPDGMLYVANTNSNSVLRYNGSTGAFVSTFIPTSSGGLNQPGDLLFHSGSLYVASQGTNRILRYDASSGAFIDTVDPSNSAAIDRPIGLLLSSNGTLLAGGYGDVVEYGKSSDATVTVSLSSPWPVAVTADYTTANGSAMVGSDYVSKSGTLTFLPGQVTQDILIPILDDSTLEGNETFFVNLLNPIGATIADGQGVGTIIDNELPPTKFYVVNDGSPDRTYEYSANGSAIENYAINSGNTSPRGAASNVAGDTVWVADKNCKVYVYNTSGGLLGSWSAGTLASNALVEGIATNGTDVWIVDSKSDKVFRYAGAASRTSGSQNAASSFSLNSSNKSSTGIVTDGTHLWIVDNGTTDKVFKYTVSGSLVGSWMIDSANKTPTGLTIDPTGASQSIWIVDSGTDKVYEYTNTRAKTSGSQSAALTFNLAAGNTNPQGIADPPPPSLLQPVNSRSTSVGVAVAANSFESIPAVRSTYSATNSSALRASDARDDERRGVNVSTVARPLSQTEIKQPLFRSLNTTSSTDARPVRTSPAAERASLMVFDEALLEVLAEAN